MKGIDGRSDRAVGGGWWRRRAKWVVLWSAWAAGLLPPRTAPVRLPAGGLLRGVLAPDGSHAAYTGIPYASVPVRFQAPGPAARWRGVLDAVDEHVRCAQRAGPLVLGGEDCLRLNVYVPLGAEPGSLPVMVYVHGGGFFEGSGSRLLYGPDYLVARGVILVTFNYRVGPPGFLCLGTRAAPGNAGLKDQVAALRWVRDNIAAFGGDPDSVTLFGESAGAASVSLHLLSPLSAGLFHRAILQSGSALAPWVERSEPPGPGAGADLARSLGEPVDLPRALLATSAAELVVDPVPHRPGRMLLERLTYAPCVESRLEGVDPFLTESPLILLSRGAHARVPVIIGFNAAEGAFFTAMEEDATVVAPSLASKLPTGLRFPSTGARARVARAVRRAYSRGSKLDVRRMARYYGDAYFGYPARAEAALWSRNARVFAYRLARAGWRDLATLWAGPRYWRSRRATHADDLFYLFRVFPLPAWIDAGQVATLTTYWTNFAKYGDPNGAGGAAAPGSLVWPAVGREPRAARALCIDWEPRVEPLWHSAELRMWRRLYRRYGGH